MARLGFDLVINYAANAPAAKETAADCLAKANTARKTIRTKICRADISRSSDRKKLIEFTKKHFGRLDLLVNNAGVAPSVRADILDASEESFDRLIAINVKGPYFLTQLTAKWMIEEVQSSKFKVQSPKIITVSSISAYTASTNRGDYCISKAALSMLTLLYAARLAEHGINVYEIRPASNRERPDLVRHEKKGGCLVLTWEGFPRQPGDKDITNSYYPQTAEKNMMQIILLRPAHQGNEIKTIRKTKTRFI